MIEQVATYARADLELYTAMMFKEQYKKPFITAPHHRRIFDALQRVVDGETKKLIINIAPRYSKTEIAVKSFISWGFAVNPKSKFIHLSYSDALVQDNSRAVQDVMTSPLYEALFPNSTLPSKRSNKSRWGTIAGGGMYAVSTQGQVTGFGAGEVDEITDEDCPESLPKFSGAIVIDDPIKPEDALSDVVRERVNNRFETTIRNRVNSRNTPIIIIMQRLHENDLCGYLMKQEPGEWTVLSLPCLTIEDGEEKALWEHKHTVQELYKIRDANSFVFETQYMQNPTPLEGLMYERGFREYESLPISKKSKAKNYTDTADTGSDYLCSVCYVETSTGMYITDVLYTKKPMEYTEIEHPKMMHANQTQLCLIESNNGGRGYGRKVEENSRIIGNTKTSFRMFTQSTNKNVRIFSKSADVQNLIFMPKGWAHRFPEFYRDVTTYRKEGRNSHDDAPDVLTGMVENFGKYTTVNEEDFLRKFQ